MRKNGGRLALALSLWSSQAGRCDLRQPYVSRPYVSPAVALCASPRLGGLLNATFGNVTELIVSMFAIKAGLLRIVQVCHVNWLSPLTRPACFAPCWSRSPRAVAALRGT